MYILSTKEEFTWASVPFSLFIAALPDILFHGIWEGSWVLYSWKFLLKIFRFTQTNKFFLLGLLYTVNIWHAFDMNKI